MHPRLSSFCASALLTLGMVTSPSYAIVIRHDKPAEQYLATPQDFPPLATFYQIGVHGTLIAPDWVLTAAHTVFCLNPGQTIQVGQELVKVKARFSYPSYQLGGAHDLALIQLASPIHSVAPARLYQQQDEKQQSVWFIGSGGTGNGLTGETVGYGQNQGVLRKAQNKIVGVTDSDLRFVFESGKDALEFEGVSGNGDSGGPAFIIKDGHYYLLGVSSRVDSWFKDVGEYGVKELYTRVSTHADWILQLISAPDEQRLNMASTDAFLHEGMTSAKMPKVCAGLARTAEQL